MPECQIKFEPLQINDYCEEVIDIFVPLEIKRRGGTAMVIVPKNAEKSDDMKCFDNKLIKAIAKAYKWKLMLDQKQISSLADIARKENLGTAYVSKVFNLNFRVYILDTTKRQRLEFLLGTRHLFSLKKA